MLKDTSCDGDLPDLEKQSANANSNHGCDQTPEPTAKLSTAVDSSNDDEQLPPALSPKKAYLSRTASFAELCRVCQQEKEEILIDLGCHCRGGLAKAHRSCIDTWFCTRGSNKCEICQEVAANVPPPDSQPSMSEVEEQNEDFVDLDPLDSESFQNEGAKGKRRRRSNVWSFFEMVSDSEKKDGKPRARCKLCGVTYMAASKYGTGNMKRHIDTCPRRSSRDIGQCLLSQNSGSGSVSISNLKFDTSEYRQLLIAAIVKHELPFRFVEYSGVRSLLQYLRPDVPIISRNTAKADLVKMYHREKKRIRCFLNDSPGRISLTSDLWTSITTDGYMCITAHFLDKKWVLQKRVLNFSFMPPPHNGISLSEKIYNLLCEWGIQHKIFVLTLDNASSNDVSVELLRTQLNIKKALVCDGEFFHLRCCAHILNLVVQDGLKEIDHAIQKVRESIKYVKGSQTRKVKFLDSTNQMSLDSKKGLRQDVPTRWNSTYLMLESAIFYRRAFSHLELTDSNFKHCPSNSEWEKVEKIKGLLSVFYEATCDFSGTKYPTANLYFPAVFLIYFTLKRHSQGEDDYLKRMSCQMLTKFEKYWSEFNVLLAIAVILDPRYKLHFVDFSYTKLYGDCSIEFMNVRTKMASLFMEYASSSVPTCSTMTSESNVSGAESESSVNKQVFQFLQLLLNLLLVLVDVSLISLGVH
ncbi:hypothetical protein I3760_11G105700 [Carya illinoinensis]|nr:hypothetical protein I3760_11G105700 [Carya illinoinensis]